MLYNHDELSYMRSKTICYILNDLQHIEFNKRNVRTIGISFQKNSNNY